MGNYNTWGGKNNSWGNKNRKGGSNSSGSSNNNNQEPNKLFNVLAGGVVIFLLGSAGLSVVTEGFGMIKDSIETTQKVAETVNKDNRSERQKEKQRKKTDKERQTEARTSEVKSESLKLSIDDIIDDYIDPELTSEDVADILDFVNEQLSGDSEALEIEQTIVLVNDMALLDETVFKEKVIDQANKIGGGVSFLIQWDGPVNVEYIDEGLQFIENCLYGYKDDINRNIHPYIRWGGSGEKFTMDGKELANYVYYINFFR